MVAYVIHWCPYIRPLKAFESKVFWHSKYKAMTWLFLLSARSKVLSWYARKTYLKCSRLPLELPICSCYQGSDSLYKSVSGSYCRAFVTDRGSETARCLLKWCGCCNKNGLNTFLNETLTSRTGGNEKYLLFWSKKNGRAWVSSTVYWHQDTAPKGTLLFTYTWWDERYWK